MTAFNIPAERATKTRSPFNWQLASAKGFRPGLACRPTSRPWELPAFNIHTERATQIRSPFNCQLASAKGFRPGLACGPASRPWAHGSSLQDGGACPVDPWALPGLCATRRPPKSYKINGFSLVFLGFGAVWGLAQHVGPEPNAIRAVDTRRERVWLRACQLNTS